MCVICFIEDKIVKNWKNSVHRYQQTVLKKGYGFDSMGQGFSYMN